MSTIFSVHYWSVQNCRVWEATVLLTGLEKALSGRLYDVSRKTFETLSFQKMKKRLSDPGVCLYSVLYTMLEIGTCCGLLHDVIAIPNWLSHSGIFLTLLCNRNWRDITHALLRGQKSHNYRDICVQLFLVKLQVLKAFEIYEKYFEKGIANFTVIDFQKRGLLHVLYIFVLLADHEVSLM